MEISNFDKKMFSIAKGESLKSDCEHFKLGCVITYKRKIISFGHNKDKTHPAQKKFNKYRNFNNNCHNYIKHSIHAEIDAISSIPFLTARKIDSENGWNKVKIYVYRYAKTKKLACAKPCNACMEMIKSLGIKHLYYTEDYGIGYINILDNVEEDLV